MYITMIALIGALGFGGLSYWLIRALAGAKQEIRQLEKQAAGMKAAISERDHVISRMQEVFDEADGKKKKLKTGSPKDRFNASLDILSGKLPDDKPDTDKPTDRPSYLAPVSRSFGDS